MRFTFSLLIGAADAMSFTTASLSNEFSFTLSTGLFKDSLFVTGFAERDPLFEFARTSGRIATFFDISTSQFTSDTTVTTL